MSLRSLMHVLALALACAWPLGCASANSPAAGKSPASEQAASSVPQGYAQPGAYAAPAAPPPAPARASPGGLTPAQPVSPAPSRTLAVASAASEIDSSQRELDVAAGDCQSACRALGSMDRAAGHLCELTQGEEGRACEDAKRRVYSARTRVKATCGECPGGPSVDRNAPIPSLR